MLLEVNESSSTLQLSLGLVLYRLVLYQDSRVGNVCVCVWRRRWSSGTFLKQSRVFPPAYLPLGFLTSLAFHLGIIENSSDITSLFKLLLCFFPHLYVVMLFKFLPNAGESQNCQSDFWSEQTAMYFVIQRCLSISFFLLMCCSP